VPQAAQGDGKGKARFAKKGNFRQAEKRGARVEKQQEEGEIEIQKKKKKTEARFGTKQQDGAGRRKKGGKKKPTFANMGKTKEREWKKTDPSNPSKKRTIGLVMKGSQPENLKRQKRKKKKKKHREGQGKS